MAGTITWELDPRTQEEYEASMCRAPRGSSKHTRCELPPDHVTGRNSPSGPFYMENHFGRSQAGRWYSWKKVD